MVNVKRNVFFNIIMVAFGAENSPHCEEYRDILAKYQTQMSDYETCIIKSAEQVAQIRIYENTLTSGLQHQVDALRRDQRWA